MAIILIKAVETEQGIIINDAYVNIEQVYIHKPSRSVQILAVVFANKEKRLENKKNIEVPGLGIIQDVLKDDIDLSTTSIFDIAYFVLKSKLNKMQIEFTDDI